MSTSDSDRTSSEAVYNWAGRAFNLSRFGGALAIITFPISVSLSQMGLFLALVGWIACRSISRRLAAMGREAPPECRSMAPEVPLELKLGILIYGTLLLSLLVNLFYQPSLTEALLYFRRGLSGETRDVALITMALWTVAYGRDPERREDLYRWTRVALYIIIISGLIAIFSKFRLGKFLYHLQHGWVPTSIARYQHHAGTILGVHLYMPVGFMGTHLTYAALAGFGFPFLFFRTLHNFIENPRGILKPRGLFHAAMLGALCLVLALNNGRSALFGIAAALAVGLYYFTRVYWGARVVRVVPVILGVVVVLGGLYAVSPTIHDRFERIIDGLSGESKHTDWQRPLLWRGTFDMMSRAPVFGYGPGEFGREIDRTNMRLSKENPRLWQAFFMIKRGHAHNDVFHMQAAGGIAASAAYFVFFAFLIARLFRRASTLDEEYWKWGVLAIFVGGLFQCYFLDDEVLLPFWFFVGLAISATSGADSEN